MPADTVGAYRVVRALAPSAGWGPDAVLAQRDDDSVVVVKRFVDKGLPRARVLRELRQATKLKHDAIAGVVEWFEDGDVLCAVMLRGDGVSLEALLDQLTKRGDVIGAPGVWHLAAQICDALAVAHEIKDDDGRSKNVVHGHFGPDRVIVSPDGNARVHGIGVPSLFGEHGRSDRALAHRPPEQRSGGHASASGDTFSVATLIAGMLTNEWSGARSELAARGVADALVRALETAMDPAPAARVVSCRGLSQLILAHADRDAEPLRGLVRLFDAAPARTEDSTLQRLGDLFDALPLGAAEPQRDSTDEGWLLDTIRKSAPAFTVDDEPPSSQLSKAIEGDEAAAAAAAEAEAEAAAEAEAEADAVQESEPRREAIVPSVDDGSSARIAGPPPLPQPSASPSPPPTEARRRRAAVVRAPQTARAPSRGRNWLVTLLGAGLAAVVALAAARFVMGDGAGSEPSVETPSATASSTTTPAQADSGPTRADAATPAGAIDAGSEGDAADAGSSDASDAGADATSDAGADAATDDAGASADDADAPPNERDFPALVDELGDVPTLASEGYLIVRCPVRAEVFVNGVARGFTNSKVKSSCWTRNVRLRDPETQQWITEGQPVTITCMATTTVTIIP